MKRLFVVSRHKPQSLRGYQLVEGSRTKVPKGWFGKMPAWIRLRKGIIETYIEIPFASKSARFRRWKVSPHGAEAICISGASAKLGERRSVIPAGTTFAIAPGTDLYVNGTFVHHFPRGRTVHYDGVYIRTVRAVKGLSFKRKPKAPPPAP